MRFQFQAVFGVCAGLALAAATPGTASAQVGCATCGHAGSSAGTCSTCGAGGKSNCGICGLKPYPLNEKKYIAQFCSPTICPGSCFGYYRTQWTPWVQACPNWVQDQSIPPASLNWGPPSRNEPIPAPVNAGPNRIPPATPDAPAGGTPLKEPSPAAPKDTRDVNPAAPKGTIPQQTPAPKPPTAPPAGSGTAPKLPLSVNSDRGLILPPVPEIPAANGQERF